MGMGAGAKSGRRATMNEINVTPLVDVMLVLLIMFMVTAPLMQQGIEVDLPKTSSAGVELNDEPFVIVIGANRKITAAKNPMKMGDLKAKLQAAFKSRKNKQVYIQADKHVDYGTVAEVMAEVRAAGILNIGLVTLPKDK